MADDDERSGSQDKAEKRPRRRVALQMLTDRPREPERRKFVVAGTTLALGGFAWSSVTLSGASQTTTEERLAPVRPPSASRVDTTFQQQCIRCGLCGTVCENGCIRFFDLDEPAYGAFTPYLDVRRRACTLCMRCTQICPSGALTPIEDDFDSIVAAVNMGPAEVEPELCLSYQGRVCGYCHDACPLPGRAIRLQPPALPVVLDDCVGCGQCVEACPQTPTAIRIPRRSA